MRKSILNAILKVLRLEEIKNPSNGQNYTITSLIERIKENAALYADFKLKLFRWCKTIFEDKKGKEISKTKSDIAGFLQELVTAFGGSLTSKTAVFIKDAGERQNEARKSNASYVYDCDIDLKVRTIHSVKGQTYTGVLYLETFKGQQPTKGEARDNRTFESQKLSSYITGSTIGGNNETSFIALFAPPWPGGDGGGHR